MTAEAIRLSSIVPAQRSVLEQLMQLYLHDFSEFAPIETNFGDVDTDGQFKYPYLASYFAENDRVALLVHVGAKIAGCVLLNRVSHTGLPVDHAVAEFFVMRKFRRAGVGTRLFRQLLAERPGTWEICIADYNAPARAFWPRATEYLEGYRRSDHRVDTAIWNGPIIRLEPAQPDDIVLVRDHK